MNFFKISLIAIGCYAVATTALASIEPTSGRYVHTDTDLSVKVVGGEVSWQREWRNNRWHFNRQWVDLQIEYNASDGSIRRILRNNDVYEPTGSSATRFRFGARDRIQITDTGFRWYDRNGNWVDYDPDGRIVGYGERNGTCQHIPNTSATFSM